MLYHLLLRHNLLASSIRCYNGLNGITGKPNSDLEHKVECKGIDASCFRSVFKISGVKGLDDRDLTVLACVDKGFKEFIQMTKLFLIVALETGLFSHNVGVKAGLIPESVP